MLATLARIDQPITLANSQTRLSHVPRWISAASRSNCSAPPSRSPRLAATGWSRPDLCRQDTTQAELTHGTPAATENHTCTHTHQTSPYSLICSCSAFSSSTTSSNFIFSSSRTWFRRSSSCRNNKRARSRGSVHLLLSHQQQRLLRRLSRGRILY